MYPPWRFSEESSDDILKWKVTHPDLAFLPSEESGEKE
jgi:hypothetical protein